MTTYTYRCAGPLLRGGDGLGDEAARLVLGVGSPRLVAADVLPARPAVDRAPVALRDRPQLDVRRPGWCAHGADSVTPRLPGGPAYDGALGCCGHAYPAADLRRGRHRPAARTQLEVFLDEHRAMLARVPGRADRGAGAAVAGAVPDHAARPGQARDVRRAGLVRRGGHLPVARRDRHPGDAGRVVRPRRRRHRRQRAAGAPRGLRGLAPRGRRPRPRRPGARQPARPAAAALGLPAHAARARPALRARGHPARAGPGRL